MQPSPLFRWTREPEAKLLPHKLRINLQTKVATSNRVIDALVPVRYPWTRCILSLLCSDTHNLTTRKIKTTLVPFASFHFQIAMQLRDPAGLALLKRVVIDRRIIQQALERDAFQFGWDVVIQATDS